MKRNRCGGVGVESGGESLISSARASLLFKSARVSGLSKELSRVLSPWRLARSVQDPGKTVLDLAVTIALGSGHRQPHRAHLGLHRLGRVAVAVVGRRARLDRSGAL